MNDLIEKIQFVARWLKWLAGLVDAVVSYFSNNPIPSNAKK